VGGGGGGGGGGGVVGEVHDVKTWECDVV